MSSATIETCPSCGAVHDPASRACKYCGCVFASACSSVSNKANTTVSEKIIINENNVNVIEKKSISSAFAIVVFIVLVVIAGVAYWFAEGKNKTNEINNTINKSVKNYTPSNSSNQYNMPTSEQIGSENIAWNGQESSGSYLSIGPNQLPLNRFQMSYQGTYQWGGSLTNKEENTLLRMAIPDEIAEHLAVYQVGGHVFLLPQGWQVVKAEAYTDGSELIIMRGNDGWMEFSSDGGCAGCAAVSSEHWMPWIQRSKAYPIQAVSLDNGIASAYSYNNSGQGLVNAVAIYNSQIPSFKNMMFYYDGGVNKLPTEVLNYFLFLNNGA